MGTQSTWGTNKTQNQTFRNKMLNKLAFASALLFGWAAAAKERYVGSCKATDLDGNPRGWAKFRQEPDSDEVFRQFVLTGFHAGEEVKVHMYNSMSEPKETWTLKADENGAVVINEKTHTILMMDTLLESLDCFIHVKKDRGTRENRKNRRDDVLEPSEDEED